MPQHEVGKYYLQLEGRLFPDAAGTNKWKQLKVGGDAPERGILLLILYFSVLLKNSLFLQWIHVIVSEMGKNVSGETN